MDRRQFFGACAAAVVGAVLPKPRQLTQEEVPWLIISGAEFVRHTPEQARYIEDAMGAISEPFQRLNTALPPYDGHQRFSPFEFEVTAP